jgi:ribonucleoside-diphosphate reductase alpha chain
MQLSEAAHEVLRKRYYRNGEKTPEELFRRVAKAVAQGDTQKEERYYDMMINLNFLPNSPTLMNAGTPLGQLSACFVLPIEDSMIGIFDALKNMAMVQKSGGGTGFDFTPLRPTGANVSSTYGHASGPVSFMKAFNACTEVIKQGGTRRGANMGMLRVDHPDILEFIKCKDKEGEFANFNISVAITDEFMKAVELDKNWILTHDVWERKCKNVKARELWDALVHQAWKNGEPGVVFIDQINRKNSTPELGPITATNPCGEQPLYPYESCNLGSINLANMIMTKEGQAVINWKKMSTVIVDAVLFLNDVLDINKFPLPQIKEATLRTRKIGLGVMGWADMLFKLDVRYDSEEAIKIAKQVMSAIEISARVASKNNATVTTIAPTGTLSLIAGVSGGIEPCFALAYTKQAVDGKLTVFNKVFENYVRMCYSEADEILEAVAETGKWQVPNTVFVTASEIEPIWHVKMQATFQWYTDNAVSKTVNLPQNAVEEDVSDIMFAAWHMGCKGITVYRDKSREIQAQTAGTKSIEKEEPDEMQVVKFWTTEKMKRPKRVYGFTEQVQTGCGKLYVTVNYDDATGKPLEVFIVTSASGGCAAFAEGVARVISLALRSGADTLDIIDQLKSVKCSNFIRRAATNNGIKGKSCPDVIGDVLKLALETDPPEENFVASETTASAGVGNFSLNVTYECPEENCSGKLVYSEGCLNCMQCGWSKC